MRVISTASLVPGWSVANAISDRTGRASCSSGLGGVRFLQSSSCKIDLVLCDPWDRRLDTNLVVLPDSPDELVEALIYVNPRLGRSLHLRRSERSCQLQALCDIAGN